MDDRLDIVLFGATGFTGKHCIEKLHRLSKANGRSLTWGVAGRSRDKLQQTLSEFKHVIGEELNTVPIMEADVKDYDSLKKMTRCARVIINCIGPYRFYGEPVIKACLETGTHHVDVSGEPQYMELIQLKYHEAAREKGIYIVSACGFDSIPTDMGVVFLQKNFGGTLNSVETFITGGEEPPTTPGPYLNYATWESAVNGLGHAHELRDLRRKLFPTRLPGFKPRLEPKPTIHKSDVINSWCIPFLGADRSVVIRSQRYLFEEKNTRPAQVQAYLGFDSFTTLILMVFFGSIFTFLAKYEFGRNLLLKHPRFFSYGLFAHENPPERKINRTKFTITIYGQGWSEKLPDAIDEYSTPPNKTMITKVSGSNPGYGTTCSCVTLAAIVIITEKEKLPIGGGVYPPGAAFVDTTLIEQLQENGLSFEIERRE